MSTGPRGVIPPWRAEASAGDTRSAGTPAAASAAAMAVRAAPSPNVSWPVAWSSGRAAAASSARQRSRAASAIST